MSWEYSYSLEGKLSAGGDWIALAVSVRSLPEVHKIAQFNMRNGHLAAIRVHASATSFMRVQDKKSKDYELIQTFIRNIETNQWISWKKGKEGKARPWRSTVGAGYQTTIFDIITETA